ncbi:MAB_1171c family putative transporter [Micromonospora echinospora]|uniref:MAB_1171c family putative transporter n=1 Tax=Micromonospora echinospora TaxID=1877 RepID=UPI003A888815
MHALLYPGLAVLAWTAVGVRLATSLRDGTGNPARAAVTSTFALLALTFTVSTPAVWAFADRAVGVDNIAALIAHLCVVGFSTSIQVLLLCWTNPPERAGRLSRYRLVALAMVVLVLVVLFCGVGPTDTHSTDFVATYAHRPQLAAYLLMYLAAFSAGLVDIIRICWPYARLVGPGWLRRGLRTTAVGAAVGLVYTLARVRDVIAAICWDGLPRLERLVPITASTGALLVIGGLTMPAWGPRLAALPGTAHRIRLLRQLRPLWAALCAAVPAVRLAHDRRWWRPADRLHRRVIEIYDARLVLRPYLSEAVGDRARRHAEAGGLGGDDLAAVVEAAKLRAALAAMRADVRPRRPELPGPPDPALDEVREVEQLARVARAFATSPLVGAAVRETAEDAAGGEGGW